MAKSIEEVNKQRYSKYNRESQTGKRNGNNRSRAETKQRKCSRCGLSHICLCVLPKTLSVTSAKSLVIMGDVAKQSS